MSLTTLSKKYGAVGDSIPAPAGTGTESLASVIANLFGGTSLLGVFPLSDLV